MIQGEPREHMPRLLGNASWRGSHHPEPGDSIDVHPDVMSRFVRVSHAFASGAPFDDLLHEIASAASLALRGEVILIRQTASDNLNFLVQSALGPAPLSIGGLVGAYCVISDHIREMSVGDSVAINLIENAEHPALSSNEIWSFQQLGGQRLLLVPLFAGGALIGRLDIVRTRNLDFEDDAIELTQVIASYAAQALHTHRLQQAAEESEVFQTVLGLHQSIEHLADPHTILQAVAELVIREPGCARCYAMLWDSERNTFVPTAVAGLEPHMVDMLKLISLSPQAAPAFDQMMHSSRPLLVADATKSTLLPQPLVRALGIRAAMIVPLRGRHKQTIGFILVDQNEEGVYFNEHQVTLMSGMARHLSAMIENAILYDRAVSSSDSLSVINEIGIQLAMLTDEPSLFRQLHYQVSSVIDTTYFAVALLSGDRSNIEIWEAPDGKIADAPLTVRIKEDVLSRVMTTGRPSLTGDRNSDDTNRWPTDYEGAADIHSQLTVPITVGRNVIGALSVHSPYRHAYSPQNLDLLSAIALHTGIAIENARLYRLTQARGDRRAMVLDAVIHRHELERKELVNDIHENTLQTLAACLYRLDRAQDSVGNLGSRDDVIESLEGVRDELSSSIDRLRKRIFELRPATLDVLGLEPALRDCLKNLENEIGVTTHLEASLPHRLSPEHETVVYRIIQEALAHIQVRGTARHIAIKLRGDDGLVSVTVHADHHRESGREGSDDGPAANDVRLMALIERTELAGGDVRIGRSEDGQMVMRITVPAATRSVAGVVSLPKRPITIEADANVPLSKRDE
jgi:GAF domain-containing protein